MRARCPHCKAWALCRSSEQMSSTMRKGYFCCTNIECGHIFTAWLTAFETVSPSATPDPAVMLPLSTHVRRDHLRTQLDTAPTAEPPPELLATTSADTDTATAPPNTG